MTAVGEGGGEGEEGEGGAFVTLSSLIVFSISSHIIGG